MSIRGTMKREGLDRDIVAKHTIRSAVQCSTVQYSTVQYSAVRAPSTDTQYRHPIRTPRRCSHWNRSHDLYDFNEQK